MKVLLIVLSVPVVSAIAYVLKIALTVKPSEHRELSNPVD